MPKDKSLKRKGDRGQNIIDFKVKTCGTIPQDESYITGQWNKKARNLRVVKGIKDKKDK